MKATLAIMHGEPVILEVRKGQVTLDGEPMPIKNISEEDLKLFNEEIGALPASDAEGYEALLNAVRAPFIVKLLEGAVGDECISRLTHILDHVHWDVVQYLGEAGEGE